jgi:hypothetical protein
MGGPGTIYAFRPRSLFAINQTEAVHEQIAQLLEALRTGDQLFETSEDHGVRGLLKSHVSLDFRLFGRIRG